MVSCLSFFYLIKNIERDLKKNCFYAASLANVYFTFLYTSDDAFVICLWYLYCTGTLMMFLICQIKKNESGNCSVKQMLLVLYFVLLLVDITELDCPSFSVKLCNKKCVVHWISLIYSLQNGLWCILYCILLGLTIVLYLFGPHKFTLLKDYCKLVVLKEIWHNLLL